MSEAVQTVSADGTSDWMLVDKDVSVEVSCPTWAGASAAVQMKVAEAGKPLPAKRSDVAVTLVSDDIVVFDCACYVRINCTGVVNPITLRRGIKGRV